MFKTGGRGGYPIGETILDEPAVASEVGPGEETGSFGFRSNEFTDRFFVVLGFIEWLIEKSRGDLETFVPEPDIDLISCRSTESSSLLKLNNSGVIFFVLKRNQKDCIHPV